MIKLVTFFIRVRKFALKKQNFINMNFTVFVKSDLVDYQIEFEKIGNAYNFIELDISYHFDDFLNYHVDLICNNTLKVLFSFHHKSLLTLKN